MVVLAASVVPVHAAGGELEHVTVRAKPLRGGWSDSGGLLSRPVNPTEVVTPVLSVADLARLQPSIAFAGQGGLFQTLSIRGLSGLQVANFWGDLPIMSDRRAGTASSFIDPVMLDSLTVLRGPSSTYYGNGGGAGVLQLAPHRPTGLEWQLQWNSDGDENLQYLGMGDSDWSLAISRRSADDSDSASGDRLHTRFDQYNIQGHASFDIGDRRFTAQQLISEGRDIGKSNNRFPNTVTDYPEERHWLGQLSGELSSRVEASLYYHYQELDTRVEEPGLSLNEVDSESLDWGLRLIYDADDYLAGLNLGVEYFGRRGVESRETIATGDAEQRQQILDAEQDGVDLFADLNRSYGDIELSAGLRWAWQEQQNRGWDDVDDNGWSGFARAGWTPDERWLFSLEVASGTRFAGVSERFFSGTTGRGQVLGNPDLDPEETLGVDIGIQWRGSRTTIEGHVFALRIDDYIERVDLNEELRSFRNLTEGELNGAELAARLDWSETWMVELGAHYLEAEDDDGTTLSDVVAPRAFATLRGDHGPWQSSLRFEHRFSEGDVAPGEVALDSANMLAFSLERRIGSGLQLRLWGRNLLDESWQLASDRLATEAPERSLGLTLSWREGVR